MENDKQAHKKISPKSGRGLGHVSDVTPTIFGSTVGYPSDSLASCITNALQNLQSAISRAVLYIARPSVRLSPFVRPSVTRVDQSKTVGEDYAIFTVQ